MRLSNFWIPVIDSVRVATAQADQDASSLSEQLKVTLDAAVSRALGSGSDPNDVQLALFAVVAWIDERAMSRDWPGAAAWRLAPLQRHYFGTTRAGVAFFEKLEALPDEATEVREVYALMLLAGFHGRYAHRPVGEVAEYRRALLERVAQERQMDPLSADQPLFPESGAGARRPLRRARGLMPSLASLLLIVLPLCVLLGLYLFLDFRLAQTATALLAPLAGRL
ncbi:DotU family type IV/VI secretion system protein [Bordetella tumulicola]|uniref:DotU family type IV/VI secretion system protein n=1 Tax=Bordetella tumulicola TaxID=1649133 RepID=UPI0039EEC0F8